MMSPLNKSKNAPEAPKKIVLFALPHTIPDLENLPSIGRSKAIPKIFHS